MASASREAVETQIERLFRDGTLTSQSDAELLTRYLIARDEAAFEALVNLHGPMVLGLCRRMLRDPSDIDDAFQATFLVLIRKAPAIRDRGLLANWLYGVAYRVAIRARGNLLRRRERETSLAEIETPAMSVHDHLEEVPQALDQELNRLPSRYRVPLVLCYLKGLTHDQAAEEMRCPVGTVRSRLARGRNLLKRRLTARGYSPSASLLASALPAPAVPAALVRATLESAARYSMAAAAGAALASSAVETLAAGALTSMIATRIRTIALSLLALAVTSGAVVGFVFVSSHRGRSVPLEAPPAAGPKMPEPEKIALPPPQKIKPGDWLVVEVLEALPGRPISGVRIVRPDGTISLGFYGDIQVAGLDRNQIKVKVVNYLRKFLKDEVLGLMEIDAETGGPKFEIDSYGKEVVARIKPADSDRVFVDESADQYSWPHGSENRLKQIEQNLDQLTLRLDALLKTKNELGTNTAVAGQSPPPATEPDTSDTKETSLGRAFERKKYIPHESSPFEIDPSPFDLAQEVSTLDRLAIRLRKEELALAEKEKMAAQGKVSPDDVARARSSFEAAKRMIPEATRQAREHLEKVKAQAIKPEMKEEDHRTQARLSAAQSRLEEAKKLRQEGKISEEEYLDAEGDYEAISEMRPLEELSPFASPPGKSEVLKAESDLRNAEQLQSKYLPSPQKDPAKEANPR